MQCFYIQYTKKTPAFCNFWEETRGKKRIFQHKTGISYSPDQVVDALRYQRLGTPCFLHS